MIVGLTGGIGSGKSTVGDFFYELGIDIIDADELAKKVLDDNKKAKNLFIQNFGNEFLNKDNSINRNLLRTKIFKNNDKKALLESIVHPIVREEITSFIKHSKSIYKIVMVPLIFETKSQDFYDKVIVVDCDEEKQIERASLRDGKLNQDIENIIKNQASREERLSIADEIIDNNRSIDDLKNQVIKIHQKFLGIKINE